MLRVILFNTSSVVFELISLGLEELDIEFTQINNAQILPQDSYDILFIDELYSKSKDIESIIGQIDVNHKILLSSSDKSNIVGITQIVTKPFLPADISYIVKKEFKTSILDINEIESIKELLDDALLEHLDESILTKKSKKDKDLLKELFSMKTKKLKKILEGAEINISIKFPKGEK